MRLMRPVFSIFLLWLLVAAQAEAQVRTFHAPTHGGLPVSYCRADGANCGEPMATQWCHGQDYQYATEWAALAGIDSNTVTVSLGDGQICRGAQCDAFASITCRREGRTFQMPTLGAAARATVISPGRNSAATTFEFSDAQTLIPGCRQTEPDVYLCETLHQYQHCRTLMKSGTVFSCRAGLAFDGGFATPLAAAKDEYEMKLRSSAEVRVEQGQRGFGRVKGAATVEIQFAPQVTDSTVWCLQRDRYVYYPTGPKGGLSEIDDTADCETPIQVEFVPHAATPTG
jgi:hypothetical protein